MSETTPYLFFDGDCRDAMEFYKSCFGGELMLMTYGEAPPQPKEHAGAKDRIIHASLGGGGVRLMASDVPKGPVKRGDDMRVSVHCDRLEQIERLFASVSKDGRVEAPLHDAFWGARFGMCTDRFGVHWMFDAPLARRS